jgi:hypothetical protein
MADQLLEQVRDAAEGQIVCDSSAATSLHACANMNRTLRARGLRRCSALSCSAQLAYDTSLSQTRFNKLTKLDHRLHRWLLTARHPTSTLHWPRRLCPHIPRCRTPVAVLQQEPRGLAPTAQRDITVQHRRRRAKSWIVGQSLWAKEGEVAWSGHTS